MTFQEYSRKALLAFVALTYFQANLLAINPVAEHRGNPEDHSMEFTVQEVLTSDGVALCVWDIHPDNYTNVEKPKTILFSCGDYGNMSYFLPEMRLMTQNGYRVIAYDYRGFGKSQAWKFKENTLFDSIFAKDFDAVYRYAHNTYGSLILYGVSMGSVVQLLGSEAHLADLFIADSPVLSLELVAQRLKTTKGKELSYEASKAPLPWPVMSMPMIVLSSKHDVVTTSQDHKAIVSMGFKRILLEYDCGHGNGLKCVHNQLFQLVENLE